MSGQSGSYFKCLQEHKSCSSYLKTRSGFVPMWVLSNASCPRRMPGRGREALLCLVPWLARASLCGANPQSPLSMRATDRLDAVQAGSPSGSDAALVSCLAVMEEGAAPRQSPAAEAPGRL